MVAVYADENVPLPLVQALRARGQVIQTTAEADQHNRRVPDADVLAYAAARSWILMTANRRHFVRLHRQRVPHAGIVVFTYDPDLEALAVRLDRAISEQAPWRGQLVLVNRPPVGTVVEPSPLASDST